MIRDLSPRTTVQEQLDLDRVYDHATSRGMRLAGRHRVRIVVRCNQPGASLSGGAACNFKKELETTAVEATERGRRIMFDHLRAHHPSLDVGQRARLVNAIQFNLKDI